MIIIVAYVLVMIQMYCMRKNVKHMALIVLVVVGSICTYTILLKNLYLYFIFSFFRIPFGFMLIYIIHFIFRNVQIMVYTHNNKPWNILKQWYVSYLHVARTFITLSYIPSLSVLILEVIWVSLTCMLYTY